MNARLEYGHHAGDRIDVACERLIWATLLFNWLLAFVNTFAKSISQPYVILCEAVFMAAALFLIAQRGMRRDQMALLCAFAFYLVFTLLRYAYAQTVAPKPVRDMAIIFIFIGLGLAYRRQPHRLVYRLTLVVTAVGLCEMFFPDLYARLFNIKAFYINTRGFTESDFWNQDSTMFVSGTRPSERFFLAFTNWPRASSVFLEPVSLGNFIVVSLAVLLASWREVVLKVRVYWSVLLVILLLISDSRYAFACSLILIGTRLFLMRFPQQFSFLIFIGIVAGAWIMIHVLHVTSTGDNFTGRVFYTFVSLSSLDVGAVMGVKPWLLESFADSGLTYFIVCQSILGVMFLLIYYSLGLIGNDRESRFFKNAVMIAFGLNLLISNSLFSIKVAAMMWFAVGAFISAGKEPLLLVDENDAPQQQPLPHAA